MKKIVITKSVTNWHIQSVYRYMKDIESIEPIDKEKEQELTKKIQNGDEKALHELITANLRFVITVAKQFQGQGLSLDDLIAEGNAGLIVAARKFDWSKDIKFISYAVWWIRQSIMLAIAEQCRTVKVPMNKVNNIIKINRVIDKTGQLEERDLMDDEIYNELKKEVSTLTEIDFVDSMNARAKIISLDAPLDNNKDYDFLIDTFENNEEEFETEYVSNKKELYDNIIKLLKTLHPIEKDIVEFEYDLEPKVYKARNEILLTYGINDKKYETILQRALLKLKKPYRKSLFNEED